MPYRPLADEIRPQTLDEVVGQRHILGENGLLRRVTGDSRYPLSYDTAYGVRCALCGGAVMLCVILELSIVPVLVGASARFVL